AKSTRWGESSQTLGPAFPYPLVDCRKSLPVKSFLPILNFPAMSSRRPPEARMPEPFNAYHEWLGLPPDATSPTYYQILGITEFETDATKIAHAGDRAITLVRSFRPGSNAKEWSRLLDEVNSAKTCLLDAEVKREYDRCLQMGRDDDRASRLERASSPAAEKVKARAPVDIDRFPPGM